MVETELSYKEVSGLNQIMSHMYDIRTMLVNEEVNADTEQIFLDTIKTFKNYEAKIRGMRQILENKYRVYNVRKYWSSDRGVNEYGK